MRKHIGKIVMGVLLLILVISGVWASNCEKFDIFGLYSSPRCKVDAVYFSEETCSVCGNSVMVTGVLEASNFDKDVLTFSDHFSSLEEYHSLKTKVLVPSVIMALDISALIITSCYFIYRRFSKKKLEGRFNK